MKPFTAEQKALLDVEIKRFDSKWPIDDRGIEIGVILALDPKIGISSVIEINKKDFEDRVRELSQ